MGFDDDVDAARAKLRAAIDADKAVVDDVAALQALLPALERRIQSRRLSFAVSEDEDGLAMIVIVHAFANEDLGYVFAEDGEYVFESNLEDYFDDFVDEDAESFAGRLYETLRADLPKFEVENDIA